MRKWRTSLTSDRCLRISFAVLSAACAGSILARLSWHGPCSPGASHRLSWMMEITGVLQLLAAREELKHHYAGSCYARRRSGLAMALLLQSLCVIFFYSDQPLWRSLLLVAELFVLICSYQDLTSASDEFGDFVVRAGAGAGIAWACTALCFEAQYFAKKHRSWPLPLSAVVLVRVLACAVGLAVFTTYDWAFAALMSVGLMELSHVAMLEGDAHCARLCRRGSGLCAVGALLALRCTWRQLHRAAARRRGESADSDSVDGIKRVDSSIENLRSSWGDE